MSKQMVKAAALDSVRRMRAMWPAHRWGEEGEAGTAAREYGEALLAVGNAEAIRRGTTRAIRELGGKFPPPLAELMEIVRAEIRARPAPPPPQTADVPNRCPRCAEEGRAASVVVDPNGWASCTEGLHRVTWWAGEEVG